MVVGCTACLTVIAKDIGPVIAVFFWHWLVLDVSVQSAKLSLHVRDALTAYWTLVARVAPLMEAGLVDSVTTTHERYRTRGSKHEFAADRTVAPRGFLDTFVCGLGRDGHACSACLAMEEVLSKPLAEATDAAIVAVIDRPGGIVVPQFADGTVVICCFDSTLPAGLRRRLWRLTQHTQHVFCITTRQDVILYRIVTKTTRVPGLAGGTLHLHVPLVVHAP